MTQLRTLIVDADVLCRDTLRTALSGESDVEIVGLASSGKLGLERVSQLRPDVVVLDAGLADIAPAGFTGAVLAGSPQTGVILTCPDDRACADRVIDALEAGAFDFVLKPASRCKPENTAQLQRLLLQKIRCFSIRRYSRIAKSFSLGARSPDSQTATGTERPEARADVRRKLVQPGEKKEGPIEAVVMGVSTGGPEALAEIVPEFPASFPLPIVIVLHMPKHFTGRMAEALDRESKLAVTEAADGDVLEPSHAYLAPGGLHLILDRQTRQRIALRTVDDPAENGCKPSVDVLFRSAASVLRDRVLAVVLTGMGEDGTRGLRELKKHQVRVLVQDEATSVVWGMPGSAVRAGCADEILPLGRIAGRIGELCRGAG